MVEEGLKLSKKELKNLQHKAKNDEKSRLKLEQYETQQKEQEENQKRELEQKEAEEAERLANQPPKKKRKTRRGKKGRTGNQSGFKATLFIGNIPRDLTEEQLSEHFSSAKPFDIRLRLEKGFAFIEFKSEGDSNLEKAEIHRRTQMALLLHHTKIGNRTINVELSAGGGGNSQARREKIQQKNDDAEKDRKKRILKENQKKGLTGGDLKNDDIQSGDGAKVDSGMNPERAKMLMGSDE